MKNIANGGPLMGWSCFSISLFAIVFLYKKVNEIQEARLSELRNQNEVVDSVKDVILPVVSSLNSIHSTLEVLRDRSKP